MIHASSLTLATALVIGLGIFAAKSEAGEDGETGTWHEPRHDAPRKRTARLVNYYHVSREILGQPAADIEAQLAQWDVVILPPCEFMREGGRLSPDKIRERNPRCKVLVWMPLQGPSGDRWRRTIPEASLARWGGRDVAGEPVRAPWGEAIMNPVADDRGWPRHVASYLDAHCLSGEADRFDGALLDCLWPTPQFDIDANGDGQRDGRDIQAWREAYVAMLRDLRQKHPRALLAGNVGQPLVGQDPYLESLNGSMHENALGNQWRASSWRQLWDGLQATHAMAGKHGRDAMHLIVADVRLDRSQTEARDLARLSPDDLRRMRLGLATSLLVDGGHFGFDRGDCLHGQLWWFDEYDADIGEPAAPCETGSLGKGLLSRRFGNGLVVVNPTDKPVKVELGAPHFDHTTKQTAQKTMIPARDGRILERK